MLPAETEPPSVTAALDRVVDAAQNVVLDQVDLVRLEAKEAARSVLTQALLMGAGAVLVLGAWCCLAVAFSKSPARDEFGTGINRGPGPNISGDLALY